jgi:hypothetical protein
MKHDKSLEELTVRWEKDGEVVVEELDKRVFVSHAWATGVFRYRDRDRETGEFKEPRIALRRYRKRRAGWVVEAKLTFSMEQAGEVAAVMAEWAKGE